MTAAHQHDLQSEGEDLFIDLADRHEGVRLLGKMSGVESNDRNLETEDLATKRDIELHQAEQFGEQAMAKTKPPDDEQMRIMAARDVYVGKKPSEAEAGPKPPGLSPMQKAAIAAALAMGLMAAGALTAITAATIGYALSQMGAEASDYDLGLLPPEQPED